MTHSTFFHFTKSPRYFAAVDEIREPHVEFSETGRQRSPGTGGTAWNVGVGKGTDGLSKPSLSVTGQLAGYNPLGKLPGSVWHLTYPQAVERIIKGWAPTGICRECGEPRRPVVDKQIDPDARTRPQHDGQKRATKGDLKRGRGLAGYGKDDYLFGNVTATILGHACACTPFTDHPGTGEKHPNTPPAGRWGDQPEQPAAPFRLGGAPRTGPWREYHLEDWDPAPTDPPTILVSPPLPESPT